MNLAKMRHANQRHAECIPAPNFDIWTARCSSCQRDLGKYCSEASMHISEHPGHVITLVYRPAA